MPVCVCVCLLQRFHVVIGDSGVKTVPTGQRLSTKRPSSRRPSTVTYWPGRVSEGWQLKQDGCPFNFPLHPPPPQRIFPIATMTEDPTGPLGRRLAVFFSLFRPPSLRQKKAIASKKPVRLFSSWRLQLGRHLPLRLSFPRASSLRARPLPDPVT